MLAVASSLRLACTLLLLLGLLTWRGTLEQVELGLHAVQRKYFESWFLVHDVGPIPIPLPGATAVMALLGANLLLGGIVRLRKDASTLGLLVAHSGILLLLAAAFVKHRCADEGLMTLHPGQRAEHYEDPLRWELAILDGSDEVRERRVPQESIEAARDGDPLRIAVVGRALMLEIVRYHENCRPELAPDPRAEGVVEGVRLVDLPLSPAAAENLPGLRLELVAADGSRRAALLWGGQRRPWSGVVDGRPLALDLRRERHALPFALELTRFTKLDHARSSLPRSFESDVSVIRPGATRAVTIAMNEPLRADGVVVYQASWGPQDAPPGAPLYSTFAVVRNPADSLPLVACIVIASGLLFHFGRKLAWHVRRARSDA